MLKQLLQTLIDRIKPCQHKWSLIDTVEEGNWTSKEVWRHKWIYRCTKCCKSKIIKS